MKIALVFSQSGALNFFTYDYSWYSYKGLSYLFLASVLLQAKIIRRVFLNCFGNWHGPMQLPTFFPLIRLAPPGPGLCLLKANWNN